MRRSSKKWIGLVLVLVGTSLALVLQRSESERIVAELKLLAAALEFERPAPNPTWLADLRSRCDEFVAKPVTLAIAPDEERTWDTDPLIQGFTHFASTHSALRIQLDNVGVKIDPNGQRASIKGDALLQIVEQSAVRRGEPRKFAATLVKGTSGWRIIHVQISEPRIDQPEARP